MSRLSALSPPALLGIAVAILLLLGMSVVALRSGAEEPVAATASADPAAADADATVGAPSGEGDPAGGIAPTPSDAAPAAEGEAPAQDPPAAAPSAGDAPAADPPAGDPPPAAEVALPPGTCINDDGRAANTAGVAVVDCATPHTGEVHAATTVTGAEGAPYPGQSVLQADSQGFCQGQAFEDYIGLPYADSRLFVYWLVPTEESWAAGDRDVACVFYDSRGLMVGSQQGTRQ